MLEKRAKELRQQKDIQYAKSIIDYSLATNIKIESLEKCPENNGLHYYVRGKKDGNHIFVHIRPDESLSHTSEQNVVDVHSARANFREKIWWNVKPIAEVKREQTETEFKSKGMKR